MRLNRIVIVLVGSIGLLLPTRAQEKQPLVARDGFS